MDGYIVKKSKLQGVKNLSPEIAIQLLNQGHISLFDFIVWYSKVNHYWQTRLNEAIDDTYLKANL